MFEQPTLATSCPSAKEAFIEPDQLAACSKCSLHAIHAIHWLQGQHQPGMLQEAGRVCFRALRVEPRVVCPRIRLGVYSDYSSAHVSKVVLIPAYPHMHILACTCTWTCSRCTSRRSRGVVVVAEWSYGCCRCCIRSFIGCRSLW